MKGEITKEEFVYSRIGMALISAQRVERISTQVLEHLAEFGETYGIITGEFLSISVKAAKARKTLGQVFSFLKLNPKWFIEGELEEYVKMRNILVHKFLVEVLYDRSNTQTKKAIDFCYQFGKLSEQIERFFRGFIFLLLLRHVKDRYHVPDSAKEWGSDFDYFMEALEHNTLNVNTE